MHVAQGDGGAARHGAVAAPRGAEVHLERAEAGPGLHPVEQEVRRDGHLAARAQRVARDDLRGAGHLDRALLAGLDRCRERDEE